MNLRSGALLASALLLSGCAAILPAGITLSGIDAGWGIAEKLTASNAAAVRTICQRWEVDKATAAQRAKDGVLSPPDAARGNDLAVWLDAACDPAAPPQTDPIAAVVWIAGLIAEHQRITGGD